MRSVGSGRADDVVECYRSVLAQTPVTGRPPMAKERA